MKAMAFELNFNGSVEFQEGNIRGKKMEGGKTESTSHGEEMVHPASVQCSSVMREFRALLRVRHFIHFSQRIFTINF